MYQSIIFLLSILVTQTVFGKTYFLCSYREDAASSIPAEDSGYIVGFPNDVESYPSNRTCQLILNFSQIGTVYFFTVKMDLRRNISSNESDTAIIPVQGLVRGSLSDSEDLLWNDVNITERRIFRFELEADSNMVSNTDYGFKLWYGTDVKAICGCNLPMSPAGTNGRLRSHTSFRGNKMPDTFPICKYTLTNMTVQTNLCIEFLFRNVCNADTTGSNPNFLSIGSRINISCSDGTPMKFNTTLEADTLEIVYYPQQRAAGFLFEYTVCDDVKVTSLTGYTVESTQASTNILVTGSSSILSSPESIPATTSSVGLRPAVLAGSISAAVVVLLIILVIVWFVVRRNRKREAESKALNGKRKPRTPQNPREPNETQENQHNKDIPLDSRAHYTGVDDTTPQAHIQRELPALPQEYHDLEGPGPRDRSLDVYAQVTKRDRRPGERIPVVQLYDNELYQST